MIWSFDWVGEKKMWKYYLLSFLPADQCDHFLPVLPHQRLEKNMRKKWETSSQSSADAIAENILLRSKNQPIVLLEREKRISRLTRGSFTCWHLPSNWTSFSLRESHIHSWERTGSIFSKTLLCNNQSLVTRLWSSCSWNSDFPPHISSVTRT